MTSLAVPACLASPAGTLRLRPETAEDAAFLREVFDASRPLAAQLAPLPEALRETILAGQFQAQRAGLGAQYPRAHNLVIMVEDTPAGRLIFDDTGATLHIADIALSPAWRGQGIGTALLLELARSAEPRGLTLEVAEENTAAQRLYAALGFTLAARRPGYLQLARPPAAG
jgi:ribosomal protein S18 acetylase RimI-like enzyme